MSKIIAAAFLSLTAFLSAAFSQNNIGSATGEIRKVAFMRPPAAKTRAAAISSAEREAFDLINRQRAAAGLDQLVWRDDLASLARIHSEDMAGRLFFSHRGSDGSMIDDRAEKFGLHRWLAIGENIAFTRGYDDPASFAVDRWMESTSHRENLLDKRWKETGVGVAILPDGTYYFTQVFLLRD